MNLYSAVHREEHRLLRYCFLYVGVVSNVLLTLLKVQLNVYARRCRMCNDGRRDWPSGGDSRDSNIVWQSQDVKEEVRETLKRSSLI